MNIITKAVQASMSGVSKVLNKILPDIEEEDEALYPPFYEKVELLLEEAKKQGLDVGLFEGFRSWERQQKLYNQGRKIPGKIITKSPPGYSWHQFGTAADIVFKENGKWSWALQHDWKKLGSIGKTLGLEWGGSWVKLKDMPHFQWPSNMSLARARELYRKGGLPEVWFNLNNKEEI